MKKFVQRPAGSTYLRLLAGLFAFMLLSGCGVFSTRPVRHLSYAETALEAAKSVNSATSQPVIYQAAREAMLKARAAYRLKNFRIARKLAIRSRILSEEAEFRTLHPESTKKDNPKSESY